MPVSTDDWQEKLRRLEEEIACSRQRRLELREILDRLEQLKRQVDSLAAAPSPLRTGETERARELATGEGVPVPAAGEGEGVPPPAHGENPEPDGGSAPGDNMPGEMPAIPGEGGEDTGGWKARWRQAILERGPQARLERMGVLTATVAGQMGAVEGSLETAAHFFGAVASRLATEESGTPIPGHLVREVVTSESFRLLAARLLAGFLRETGTGSAHPAASPILCSEAGHPQATSRRKEVQAVKPQSPDPGFFWWIIIILLIFLLLFFFFPLGAGAGQ
ncbi:MAG: hypothetical protein AB1503_05320 [Bacillota bacterium]